MEQKRFEDIIKSYSSKLYNYINRFVHSKEDSEDILQNVFLAFYDKMDGVDEDKISSYLYRIAHNKALNLLKKRKKERLVDPYNFRNLTAEDSTESDKKELYAKLVNEAITSLPVKMAMLIELKVYNKMSYKEISQET
ncbi:MAG: hypothetical protein B6226_00005, partial [Candidatus Cloacimonetes bacterium 4572_65]